MSPIGSGCLSHPSECRFRQGLTSLLRMGLAPLGGYAAGFHQQLSTVERYQQGLIVILPGIEGCSSVNDGIARGLATAGITSAIRIMDWRRFRPWNPMHLMFERHNRSQALAVADLILNYQRDYPNRPVHLIGHSAGAGLALFVLERLPSPSHVTTVTLIAAAVSRRFDVEPLLSRTSHGIWNFYSPFDLPTVGLGTLVFGTMDRRHSVSAGALGFRMVRKDANVQASPDDPQLHQIRFRLKMMKSWNFGGHFGATNSVFVHEHIAPICRLH